MTRRKWAKRLNEQWDSIRKTTIIGFVQLGRNLHKAKADLGQHGKWQDFVEKDLKFNPFIARTFMRIATWYENVVKDYALNRLLPPDYNTIDKLTRIDEITFKRLVKDGTIHPEMKRQDVASLVRREASEQRKIDREAVPSAFPVFEDRYKLLCSDLADAEIKPESIDCIITDPPYPEEFIELYGVLARCASVWLKPGGSLLAMAGHSFIPRVLAELSSSDLNYHWTTAYLTPGGQAVQIFPRRVNTFWKPVFWFVKGTYSGEWVGDVLRSDVNDNDKRFHDWGQSESGMADIVRRFSKVGDVICDPFMGGGTTGIVALAMNRFFVGVENDARIFSIAKNRIVGGADAAMVG